MSTKLAAESQIGQYTFHSPMRLTQPALQCPCFCCTRSITKDYVEAVETNSGNIYRFHIICWQSNAVGSASAYKYDEYNREHGLEYRCIDGDIYKVRKG